MPVSSFLAILVGCSALMLVCRIVPLVALKGRELPPTVTRALGLIPPAAFAALVANDLLDPGEAAAGIATGEWGWLVPLAAACFVAVVGVKTRSMAWCIVTGVASYAALSALVEALGLA